MGKYTGMSFEKAFGMEKISFDSSRSKSPKRDNAKQYLARGRNIQDMTRNQKDFCSYLSLDTYKDAHGNMRRELIALLIQKDGQIKVEELRRPDFSKIERYRRSVGEEPIPGVFPIIGDWAQMQGYDGDGYYRFFWRFFSSAGGNECDVHSDKNRPMRKIEAKDVISCLYEAAMGMNAGAAGQLSKLHDTLDKQLQEAGEDVFIYELLQNANDYPNGNEEVDAEFRLLKFKDGDGCLLFCHTGAEFTEKNVAALCSANDQDKSDNLSAIGYKGIGFKTVFRYNNRAEVRSGRFGFAFDKKIQEKKDGIPWRTTPSWVFPKVWDGYRVEIRLFPIDAQKLSDDDGSYSQQLRALFSDERPLLFIPRVRSVKLFLDDWNNPIVRWKDDDRWCMSGQLLLNVDAEIRKSVDDALKDVDHCRIPPKYRHLERTAVSFACRRDGKRLLPEDNANLYCYLPAKDAQWGFRFLMNTDMIPNGPRNDIEYSLEVNKYFAKVAGGKFFEWIDLLIRSGQYEYDSIFALIPDFEECIKGRNEKVVEFIKEFQNGFESRLTELQVPSSKDGLVPASSIVYDSTGILKELGESIWERLGCGGDIVHKALRDSKDFSSFVKRYKTLLKIQEFGFDDLVKAVGNESFQKWLENPNANQQFFKYLDGKGELELFKYSKIFLDDKRMLGAPQDMYYHPDVEKYLKPFSDCFRYLPSSAPCRDKLSKDWFIPFAPKKLVCDILFSSVNEGRTRERLKDVCAARMFFCFLAKYKTCTRTYTESYVYYGRQRMRQVQKQKERFTREFLEKLPVVLESGETVTAIVTAEYSIFLPEQVAAQSVVANYRWINHGWVRFLNDGYFDCEDGNSIREWFLEDHGQGNNAWKLVYAWNTRDVFSAIADKFKSDIRRRIIDLRNDLGFYDFISKCIDEGCINLGWVKQQLSGWPVLDGGEVIVESSDKVMFYSNSSILHLVNSGWLDDMVLVLNERYSAQKKLFDVLGAQEFEEGNFGEIFRTLLAPHLNLDSREKVIAFHRFMATKKESFVSTNQIEVLKRLPTLISGDENPTDGLDGVYLPTKTKIDIDSEIAAGTISTEIKVLDDELCDDSTIEYWKWLGVRPLDEVEIRKKRFQKYLERQKAFVENGANDAAFKEYHVGFINTLASGGALQMLKDNGCGDLIKIVRLFSKGGELLLPAEMKWSNEFQPLCDFESFDKNGVYVSEMYCGIEGIKELFEELGVKDKFSKSDVALLANKEFCEYFWKKYLPLNESEWDKVKDYLNADLPCVLDRRGVVRKSEELYHLEINDYVLKLPDSESKLPMTDGVDKNHLSQLQMKTALSVGDSLAFLLADSDCKMYKMRGKVLEWIAKGSATASRNLVDEYRSDERAKWRNGLKDPVSVKELCAIRRKNSGQIRLFANDPHVMDLTGLGIAGDGADAMRTEVENALVWLGVQLVDDGSIEIEPSNEHVISDQVISDIAVRMLVFLAERYPDGWEQEFSAGYSRLKDLKFIKCSGFIVRCKDNDWLRAEHGTFLSKGDSIYFVDDWQSKFVYGDMVAELWEKAYKKQYSLDDLKMALDTSCGDYQLAKRIESDRVALLDDAKFMDKLQELSPSVYDSVVKLKSPAQPITTSNIEREAGCLSEDMGDQQEGPVISSREEVTTDVGQDKIKIGRYEVDDDEYEELSALFADGISGKEDEDSKKKDESKLACYRLFTYLEDTMKCEPSMDGSRDPKYVINKLYDGLGVTGPNIDINTGERIHVISARGGVAYVTPYWWRKVCVDSNHKNMICAVVSAEKSGFVFFNISIPFAHCIRIRKGMNV